MIVFLVIPGILLTIFLICTYYKIEHLKIRKDKTSIPAVVYEFKTETKKVSRNHSQIGRYANVKVLDENERITRLHYPITFIFPDIQINENIETFWYAGELQLWNAYQDGIFKYLPSKWWFEKDIC